MMMINIIIMMMIMMIKILTMRIHLPPEVFQISSLISSKSNHLLCQRFCRWEVHHVEVRPGNDLFDHGESGDDEDDDGGDDGDWKVDILDEVFPLLGT